MGTPLHNYIVGFLSIKLYVYLQMQFMENCKGTPLP